jgi:hypothetical protein
MGKYITNNRQQTIGKNSTFIETNGEVTLGGINSY